MNPTQPHQAAIRAAEKIETAISWASDVECGAAAQYSLPKDEIQQIITREYEPVVEAIQSLLDDAKKFEQDCRAIKNKTKSECMMFACAVQAREKLEALNQLTK